MNKRILNAEQVLAVEYKAEEIVAEMWETFTPRFVDDFDPRLAPAQVEAVLLALCELDLMDRGKWELWTRKVEK